MEEQDIKLPEPIDVKNIHRKLDIFAENNDTTEYFNYHADIKSIEDLCNDVKYSGIIFVDKNDEMGCINRVFYEKFPESFEYEVSDMKFMGIELEHNDKTHVINLKNNSYNYYIVNNSLNQNFFKYYIKNVIKTDIIEDNFDYKITIVDYNVNLITLLPHQYIIIDKNNYHVF